MMKQIYNLKAKMNGKHKNNFIPFNILSTFALLRSMDSFHALG